jgi:hypothetical protein
VPGGEQLSSLSPRPTALRGAALLFRPTTWSSPQAARGDAVADEVFGRDEELRVLTAFIEDAQAIEPSSLTGGLGESGHYLNLPKRQAGAAHTLRRVTPSYPRPARANPDASTLSGPGRLCDPRRNRPGPTRTRAERPRI